VVLFDFPGFGFSDKPERYSYSLFEQTDVVEALCERLGLDRPHVVAHDMGVSVACELVARRQRKLLKGDLASLMIMSAGVYDDLAKITTSQKVLLTPLGAAFGGLGIGAVFRQQIARTLMRPVESEQLDAMWEQILYLDGHKRLSQVASYLRERTRFEDRWISALRTSENLPLHLLWGNRDPTSTIEIAERLAHQIPGTELTRLFRVGHFPPIEAPAETANAITSWLDRVESAEAASNSPSAKQPVPAQPTALPEARVASATQELASATQELASATQKLASASDELASAPDELASAPAKPASATDKRASAPAKPASAADKRASAPAKPATVTDKRASTTDKQAPPTDTDPRGRTASTLH
jgi:pimeloyl-ACP methyl ester carboxylesterase